MRRKDREVSSVDDIEAILKNSHIAHIAFAAEGAPYVVAMNFGYTRDGDRFIFYFHCAGEGRKIDMLRLNPRACIAIDQYHGPKASPDTCSYTSLYESVIAEGSVRFLSGNEKKHAIERIVLQTRPDILFECGDSAIDKTTVFALEPEMISGKRNV